MTLEVVEKQAVMFSHHEGNQALLVITNSMSGPSFEFVPRDNSN